MNCAQGKLENKKKILESCRKYKICNDHNESLIFIELSIE